MSTGFLWGAKLRYGMFRATFGWVPGTLWGFTIGRTFIGVTLWRHAIGEERDADFRTEVADPAARSAETQVVNPVHSGDGRGGAVELWTRSGRREWSEERDRSTYSDL